MGWLNLSANACYDCLKLARTITDLIGSQLAAHATKRLAGHLPFYGYNIPTQHAVSVAIYHGEDVDFVFFLPTNVYNSSNSAFFTFAGMGAFGNLAEYWLTQLTTLCGLTFKIRAIELQK